jgi:2-polyprenyl-6-hydroxyphenyl methylase/3-demethylubiquinone-9 3-methyltransferase
MLRKLATTQVQSTAEIRDFFDRSARAYSEQHGHPERLLDYRISLIKRHAQLRGDDAVLDVGCGNGHHLLALAGDIRRGIGVDLSPAMIEIAQQRQCASTTPVELTFLSDDAERLCTQAADSFDLALCVGALEHMLNKAAAVTSARRVLKSGGRFFCLTVNGGYVWYRLLAPLFGLETRHLSTDRFLRRHELTHLLSEAGFSRVEVGGWTFVPKGDMPALLAAICQGLDWIGRLLRIGSLRGGLWVCAWKDE